MNHKTLSPAELKISLLSKGVAFDLDLFTNLDKDFYENQFVYDQTSKGVQRRNRVPQVLCLENKVISAILRRDSSPWNLRHAGNKLELYFEDLPAKVVGLPEKPPYFGVRLSDGTLSENVIAVAGEATPGFFLYPHCDYFSKSKPCKFCSLEGTRRTVGKEMVSELSKEQIAEATKLFQKTPWKDIPIISITTGTFLDCDKGAEYVSERVKAVHNTLNPKIPIHLLTMPPHNLDLINLYKEAGVTSLAFNIEVFDRDIFRDICPGKEQFYSYDKMLQSFDFARQAFGDYNVFCGFIWGLEPEKSTIEGYKYFLDRGISISSNVFHSDPRSAFAKKPHPSEETIRALCRAQTRLYQEYPEARIIFPVSMRSTLDFEIFRGDFK